jgi:hypothetical protein
MSNIIQNIPNIKTYFIGTMPKITTYFIGTKPNTLWLEFGVASGNTINYISKFTKKTV